MSESARVSGGGKSDAAAAAGLAIVAPRLFDGQVMRGPTAVLVRDGMVVGLAAPSEIPSGCDRVDL
ncbi:MAG: hypothetical protein HY246_01550, partial [Proteobacteria bacterium]|nr:hypothetical protein [Pseudomonadota bacterium]